MTPGTKIARQVVSLLERKPGRQIITLFALTILLPGLGLAAFGLRVLDQDRQLALREVEQGLEATSRDGADLLDRELRRLTAALDRVERARAVAPGDLPEWIRDAAAVPGRVAIAVPRAAVWPQHSVAYLPWEPDYSRAGPEADAESLRAQQLNDASSFPSRATSRPRGAPAHDAATSARCRGRPTIALGLEDDLAMEGFRVEVVTDGVTAGQKGRQETST